MLLRAEALDLITATVGLAVLAAEQGITSGIPEVLVLPIKVLLAELMYPARWLLTIRVVVVVALAGLEAVQLELLLALAGLE